MELLIVLLLILLNGLFSMSEIALVSARKTRLETDALRGDKNAAAALATAESPNRFLSTVQIGITLIGILTGIFSGENITGDLQAYFERFSTIRPYAHSLAVGCIVLIITYLSLVLGELVPKRIGLSNAEKIAKLVARPMGLLTKVTAPFVWLLTLTTDGVIKLLGIAPSEEGKVTEEEIKAIVREGTEDGEVQKIESEIVERVFSMGDRRVTSLMTHRKDMVFLKFDSSAEVVKQAVNQEMHSVYPVYENRRQNIKGVVLLKDLFKHLSDTPFNLSSILHEPQFVLSNSTAYEVLQQFKQTRKHYGLVADEHGQILGIVTMNDLLEALVGDVSEFYGDEFVFTQREDGSWLVDGQYPLSEFLRKFDLLALSKDYPFHTLSGLVLHELEAIPAAGHKVRCLGFDMEVVDMDGTRIDKLLITKIDAQHTSAK